MYRHSCRILASLSSAPPRVNALEPFADRSLIARCFCAGAVYDRSVTAAVVLAIAAQPPAIVPLAGAVVLMRSPTHHHARGSMTAYAFVPKRTQ